ncbi:MAG: hypothetical protein JRI23_29670 [Deltaproteobacteria bacterium]|jgi:cbb3-type cytochrome oxidase subunit 3|nr:hypothetical protein [Deltaproteobacteria bacterium]MBW2536319.1 hypothetical protein [Deltaproteobacteria bacterium]
MIQQLATETGAHGWAIASMLFFIGVFALVVLRIWRTPKSEHQHNARLPLEDDVHDQSARSQEVCDG